MSYSSGKAAAAARREAQVIWTTKQKERENRARKDREKEREAATEKVDRLRELRLAKEIADKEEAERAETEKKAAAVAARRSRRPAKKAVDPE